MTLILLHQCQLEMALVQGLLQYPKSIFVASTPLVEPQIVNNAGETLETSLSLTEGGQVIYDVATSLNGIINRIMSF